MWRCIHDMIQSVETSSLTGTGDARLILKPSFIQVCEQRQRVSLHSSVQSLRCVGRYDIFINIVTRIRIKIIEFT